MTDETKREESTLTIDKPHAIIPRKRDTRPLTLARPRVLVPEQQRVLVRALLAHVRTEVQHPPLRVQRPEQPAYQPSGVDALLALPVPGKAVEPELGGPTVGALAFDAAGPVGLDRLAGDGEDGGGELEEADPAAFVEG